MKEWTIHTSNQDYRFLVDTISFFKGTAKDWDFLVGHLKSYFNKKSTMPDLRVFEGNTLLAKNDFDFLIFNPSDTTNKDDDSILQFHKKKFLAVLEFSPFYNSLVDAWEELREEIDFLSRSQHNSSLKYSLPLFKKEFITKNLEIHLKHQMNLSKVDKNLYELDMLIHSASDKRLIIVIILPESYYNSEEYDLFLTELQKQKSGYLYFIISQSTDDKQRNVIHDHSIINILKAREVEEELRENVPFFWSSVVFEEAANLYVSLVDNSEIIAPFLSLSSVDNLDLFIYIYSIFILTETAVIVDMTGVPPSFQEYFDSLLECRL